MSSIVISGDTSGAVTIAAPAVAGTTTLTLPATSGTFVTADGSGNSTVSGNLTLSGGTANGVLYLNGSKVATSGSALVFDGTNLGIGTSSPTQKLDVSGRIRGYLNNTSVGNASSAQFVQDGTGDAAISFLMGVTTEWLAGVDNSDSDSFKISNITGGGDFTSTGLTLTTSGNVGIGTSSIPAQSWRPGTYLTVSNSSTRGEIELDSNIADSSSATLGGLLWSWSTQTTNHKNIAVIEVDAEGGTANQRGSVMKFFTKSNGTAAPAERARIDSSGVATFKNTIYSDGDNSGQGAGMQRHGSNGGGEFFARSGFPLTLSPNGAGNNSLYISTDYRVGINQTSPYGTLHVIANSDGNARGLYVVSSYNATSNYFYNGNASLTAAITLNYVDRSQSSAFNFETWGSSGAGDTEFLMRGDGNAYADGTWNNNGADYAEFFESATGAALTLGATVILDGNKVREATASDPVSSIIGVVRPKEPSKASMVVGNTAWNKWANKYLTDDFDRYIMEDHDVVEWIDAEGKTVSHESHRIPADVTVPADAVVKTHDDKGNKFQHYKLNPAWNPDAEYVNREDRPEWIIVGLVGQVKVLKGQPMNDRWIKMRDVSNSVEEWMIR